MKRPLLLVLVAGLAACATAESAGPVATLVTPVSLTPPPIYSLLGYRAELDLTSEQVIALDSIAQRTQRENAALVQELRQLSVDRSRGGPVVLQVQPEGVPVLERIRESNRGALQEVETVLTAEQQEASCRVARQSRGRDVRSERARQEAQRQQSRRAPGVVPADTLMGGMRGRIWPWCGDAAVVQPATAEAPDTMPSA
jgi:hypothetical protein